MPNQNKIKQKAPLLRTKKQNHGVFLVLTPGTGPVLECGWRVQGHATGETDFPSPSQHQVQTALCWGGICVYFPGSLVWFCAGPVCSATVTVNVCLPVVLDLENPSPF